jgi:hypothetical protein
MSNNPESVTQLITNFSDEHRSTILHLIKAQVEDGKTADTGLKKEAWTKILNEFNQQFSVLATKTQLQSQLGTASILFFIIFN